MDKIEITLTLHFTIPHDNLNVNSLLYGVRKNMPKLFFAILKAIFAAIEERAIRTLQSTNPSRFVKNGHQSKPRQFRTSFGIFQYRLAQVRDKVKNKVYSPLMEELSVPAYRRCMKEACESGIGLVVHMSYRNSANEGERITGNAIGKSTLHRSLQEFAGTGDNKKDVRKIPYRFLMVDGTGITLQEGKEHTSRKVEMRWALASIGENYSFDLVGFWVDKSWAYIYQNLKKTLDYSKLEVLFSDGASGIEENLLEEGMRHQRCTWHGKRDFPYILYIDGLKKADQELFKEKLESIPALSLRKSDLETLKPEDVPKVKDLAQKTEQGFRELINILPPDKYPKARRYIENLSQHVSTFFDWWLQRKEWIPINTNPIESAFSRVKNRIKFIGKRWSEKGLINWLKMWVSKVFFPDRWQEVWDQYLGVNSDILMEVVKVQYRWV